MKTAIGIDVGGTKISIVIGNTRGRILSRREIPTRVNSEAGDCVKEITANLEEMLRETSLKRSRILGVGVGIPGAVNRIKGVVPRSPHLPGWKNIPLKRIFKRKFSLPVIMANDANAAAVGEKFFGLGKKCEHFIYVTVSTGVGGGIIVHGRLLEGASWVGGEIGHMTIVPNGNQCNCGNYGCLEAYASGTAIAKDAVRRIRKGEKSSLARVLKENGSLSARDVGAAAKARDRLALDVYEQAGYYLGIGIANLLNILNPEVVSLGGGVWKSAPAILRQSMLKSCKAHAWPEAFNQVHIGQSRLKHRVGDLGALALVFTS